MAKFKKLLMLCTALMMTASVATFASCGGDKKEDSSPDISESTPTEDTSSDNTSSDDTSSDDTSSDDSSSTGGDDTTDDVVYYEEIVAGGNGSLSGQAYVDNFGTLTLTIPEAGIYGIYTEEDSVSFGAEGSTDGWNDFMTEYTFEAEAGELTLATYISNLWEDEEVTYSYYLYKMTPLVIEEMSGEAEIASNLRAPVTFVAPAAGEYVITTNQSLNWYNSTAKSDEGAQSSSYLVTATEAGNINFYVMLDDFAQEKLVFTWEILTISDVALSTGENTVDLYAGVYREVTFTATEAAIYSVAAESDLYSFVVGSYGMTEWGTLGWVEGDYENFFTFYLNAGETKTLNVYYSGNDVNWEAGPAKLETTVTVSSIQAANPSELAVGNNVFMATEEGVQATFTATEAGTYFISDNNNNSMYFEDTDGTWGGDSYKEVTLAAGESVSFTVKRNGLITISIEKAPDAVRLALGENTVNVPAGESNLEINADGNEFILTWNNENVIVYVNGEAYVAGTLLEYMFYYSYTVVTTDGNAIDNVVFTLAEFVYPTVEAGDNTVNASVNGSIYKFTAVEPGCYTFTLTGDKITNVTLGSNDSFDYPDALSAAGSISINVKAGAVIDLYVEVSEDCEIGVNVAMTSTMNYLETSVTMDETGTAPASLTIPSLPNGGVVYYVITRMTGDYNVSWDSSYDLVIYAGEEVGMNYTDCKVRLTRTMMDGPIYFIVRNNNFDGASYENVVLNFAVYEEPPAEAQGQLVNLNEETTIEIESWGSALFSFIAPAAGEYTLTTTSSVLVDLWVNGNWGYDRAWQNVIDSTTGGSYTFTLEEGEIIDFFAMEFEMGAVSFVFTITAATATPAEPVEDKVTIAVDKNELTVGAGYYLTNSNTLTLKGEYTFDWNVFVDNEETADVNDTVAVDDSFITVLVNGVEITSGTKLTYAEDTAVTIIIKSSDIAKNVYVSFTVTKTPEQVKPDNEWTNNY